MHFSFNTYSIIRLSDIRHIVQGHLTDMWPVCICSLFNDAFGNWLNDRLLVNNELEMIRSWSNLGNFPKFRCRVGGKKENVMDYCAAADIITRYLSNRSQKSGKGHNFWKASDSDTVNPFIWLGNWKLNRHITDLTPCSRANPRLLTSGTSLFMMTGENITVAVIQLLFSVNIVKAHRFDGGKVKFIPINKKTIVNPVITKSVYATPRV